MARAKTFAEGLRIPPDHADTLATAAVGFAWEECKFGRAICEDEESFWRLVSERLRSTRHHWRSREISLDAEVPGTDGDIDGHASGWSGYQPPSQFEVCYLNEVKAGIDLLPSRHAKVLRWVAEGWNAVDIAQEMGVGIHTVLRIIQEARSYLWSRDLVGMARDNKRKLT